MHTYPQGSSSSSLTRRRADPEYQAGRFPAHRDARVEGRVTNGWDDGVGRAEPVCEGFEPVPQCLVVIALVPSFCLKVSPWRANVMLLPPLFPQA